MCRLTTRILWAFDSLCTLGNFILQEKKKEEEMGVKVKSLKIHFTIEK